MAIEPETTCDPSDTFLTELTFKILKKSCSIDFS